MLYSRTLSNHNRMVITLFYYPDWVHTHTHDTRMRIIVIKKKIETKIHHFAQRLLSQSEMDRKIFGTI